MGARLLTLAELADLLPQAEDYAELRRRIVSFSGQSENAPIVKRGTSEDWSAIRVRILRRDGWRCLACGMPILTLDQFECGHIIDRCAGGCDRDSNLVAMHGFCNDEKPIHSSHEEYAAWAIGRSATMWARLEDVRAEMNAVPLAPADGSSS